MERVEMSLIRPFLKSRILFCVCALLSACATRFDPSTAYSEKVGEVIQTSPSSQTTILFLVDGLSNQVLRSELLQSHLPEIRKHFLAAENSAVHQARTLFPSLTFPSIASLLKEAPISKTGALGNSLLYNAEVISFDSASDRHKFSEIMHGNNIFSRLSQKNQKSVSFDYGLGIDATVSASPVDVKIALATTTEDYLYLDQKKLASLKLLLTETSPEHWPEFIFIHLVGVDFMSHRYGSRSDQARTYLRQLDGSLKDVFEVLQSAEHRSRRRVVSMMTADHGFSPVIRDKISVEKALGEVTGANRKKGTRPEILVLNEHRMASVYVKSSEPAKTLNEWSSKLVKKPGIETVAYRDHDDVHVLSQNYKLQFKLVNADCPYDSQGVQFEGMAVACPSSVRLSLNEEASPYFLENIAYFFQAKRHPDLVVIPSPNTAFSDVDGGFHGGPTPEEVLVPLLLRNATPGDPKSIPPLWELLQFLARD